MLMVRFGPLFVLRWPSSAAVPRPEPVERYGNSWLARILPLLIGINSVLLNTN